MIEEILITCVMGAVIGSFLAVVALRLPANRPIVSARSQCDHCDARLKPQHMVPLFSFLFLRGRCANCSQPILPLHWQMEIAATLIALAAIQFSVFPSSLIWAVFGWQLLLLAALDYEHLWLPDWLTALLAITGLALGHLLQTAAPLTERVIGGAAGFAVLWSIGFVYRYLRGRNGIGQGDAKLLGALGCWLGWQILPMMVLFAALIGLLAVLTLRITGRTIDADMKLPLGTLLVVAVIPALVFF